MKKLHVFTTEGVHEFPADSRTWAEGGVLRVTKFPNSAVPEEISFGLAQVIWWAVVEESAF